MRTRQQGVDISPPTFSLKATFYKSKSRDSSCSYKKQCHYIKPAGFCNRDLHFGNKEDKNIWCGPGHFRFVCVIKLPRQKKAYMYLIQYPKMLASVLKYAFPASYQNPRASFVYPCVLFVSETLRRQKMLLLPTCNTISTMCRFVFIKVCGWCVFPGYVDLTTSIN